MKQILDDYHQGVYHVPVYPGDRGWYELHPLDGDAKNRSLPLFYHKVVCMERRSWSEYQHPTNEDKPLKDVKNSWQYIVKEKYKNVHNDIERARYKRFCAGWNGIFRYQVLNGSLALPLTGNVHIEKPKRPRPNIGRWAGKCEDETCKADCYEDHLGDVICSECGFVQNEYPIDYNHKRLDTPNGRDMDCAPGWLYPLVWRCGYPCLIEFWDNPEDNDRDPDQILDHPIKYDDGSSPAAGGSEWVAISGDLDYRTLPGYGLRKSREERSFPGEANLTTPGKGSAATTREDKQIRHFCCKHGSYLARPIWWTNPDNKNGKYWFCLKCQKAAGVVDFPQKWTDEDLAILKALGYESGVWYAKISRYLNSQLKKSEDQIDPDTKNSLYHYQKVLESDRYLKTAVLTALAAMDSNPYTRLSKGGRPAGNGADSIARWCRTHFAPITPLRANRIDDNSLRGAIRIIFNVNSIRKILVETKSMADKPP